jgi:hypothetical protein
VAAEQNKAFLLGQFHRRIGQGAADGVSSTTGSRSGDISAPLRRLEDRLRLHHHSGRRVRIIVCHLVPPFAHCRISHVDLDQLSLDRAL